MSFLKGLQYAALFFVKNTKISIRLDVFIFWTFLISKGSIFVLIFFETFLLFNGENYS